jgi:hypothetical protein
MNYKAYGDKKITPSRMTRKRARRDVFIFNKKETKRLKALQRRERRALAESE